MKLKQSLLLGLIFGATILIPLTKTDDGYYYDDYEYDRDSGTFVSIASSYAKRVSFFNQSILKVYKHRW